jgi:hypothetical protein
VHRLAHRLLGCPWDSQSDAARMENHDELGTLSKVILRYLDTHTDAADTVEGISQWWVTRQRYEDSMAAVERALTELEKQKLVKRSTLADGTVIYSRS